MVNEYLKNPKPSKRRSTPRTREMQVAPYGVSSRIVALQILHGLVIEPFA